MDEHTCGRGMAAQASFPETLSENAAALAQILNRHTAALPHGDSAADAEREAWQGIVEQLTVAAGHLHEAAARMRASRDLPVPPHDMAAMRSSENVQAFDDFVAAQLKLGSLLEQALPDNEEMQTALHAISHD